MTRPSFPEAADPVTYENIYILKLVWWCGICFFPSFHYMTNYRPTHKVTKGMSWLWSYG